jgi:hypothetical protein
MVKWNQKAASIEGQIHRFTRLLKNAHSVHRRDRYCRRLKSLKIRLEVANMTFLLTDE